MIDVYKDALMGYAALSDAGSKLFRQWLGECLISNIRQLKMHIVKRRCIVILVITALPVAAMALWWMVLWRAPSNPPYTIELRDVSSDGTVHYKPLSFEGWNHDADITGIRDNSLRFVITRDTIYYEIGSGGLTYCFSKSGHVYAMDGAENNDPSHLIREWAWRGDPHQFPYYSFSKTSWWWPNGRG